MKWFCLLAFTSFAAMLSAAETNLFFSLPESNVLCVRAAHLTENFPDQWRALQPTNRIVGTVLDLRFADGPETAAGAANTIFTTQKSRLVVLVNGQTRGAAAELARQLRAAGAAVVIGSTNTPGKISPDIAVDTAADAEKKFQENPFATTATSTNAAGIFSKGDLVPFVDHMSEAELVHRKIKDGEDSEDADLTPRAAPPQPVIRDPALARAVDLLKALAVLKPARG
jgi:hypothetical protein